jgi:hypothetical protein
MENKCSKNHCFKAKAGKKTLAVFFVVLIMLFLPAAFARPVSNFTAEILDPCTVRLAWNRGENYDGAFQLVYERIGNPYYNVLDLQDTSYTIDWLIPGSEYRFFVGNETEDPEDSMYFDISRYIRLNLPEAEEYTKGGFRVKSAKVYRHKDNKDWLKSRDRREIQSGDLIADAANDALYYTLVVNYDFDEKASFTRLLWVLTAPDGSAYFDEAEIDGAFNKETDGSQSLTFLYNEQIKDMMHYSDYESGTYILSAYIDGKLAVEKSVEW